MIYAKNAKTAPGPPAKMSKEKTAFYLFGLLCPGKCRELEAANDLPGEYSRSTIAIESYVVVVHDYELFYNRNHIKRPLAQRLPHFGSLRGLRADVDHIFAG